MVGTRNSNTEDSKMDDVDTVNNDNDSGSVSSQGSNVTNPNVPFCRTPSEMYGGDKPLNFKKKMDLKIYEKAISPLTSEKFNCDEDNLHDFLTALQYRAADQGWDNRIMMIPINNDPINPAKASMLTNHVKASIEWIRAHEEILANNKTRAGQDMNMLYQCLWNTLSAEGRTKINTNQSQYMVEDAKGKSQYSGNLLLKVILQKSHVNNRSGAYSIQQKLMKLDELMVKCDFNITTFNTAVKDLLAALDRHSQQVQKEQMIFYLLKAYKSVPVNEFTSHIDYLKERHESEDDNFTLSVHQLMNKADDKYRTQDDEESWKLRKDQKDQIIALEAKISKLQKQTKRRTEQGSKDTRGKHPKYRKRTSAKTEVQKWRKPKDLKKPVTIDGKLWYWCSKQTGGKCEGILRTHKPSDCQGSDFLKIKNAKEAAKATKKKKTTIEASVATIAPMADEDSSMDAKSDEEAYSDSEYTITQCN